MINIPLTTLLPLVTAVVLSFAATGCSTTPSYSDYNDGSDVRYIKDRRLNRETAVTDSDESQVERQRRILRTQREIEADKQQANHDRIVSPLKTFHDAAEQLGFRLGY